MQLAKNESRHFTCLFSFLAMECDFDYVLLGYVTDERGSLGEVTERVQWTKQRGEFCSAVENFKGACCLQKFSVTASGQANAKRL